MQTIIYIDGFNLYYSALTKSAYKWLDIYMLFAEKIIRPVNPESEIVKIKFFTSPILGKYSKDRRSPERQTKYHNALNARHPGLIEIIQGYHTLKITSAYHFDQEMYGSDKVKVTVIEEKQTDVSIGVSMYRDAANTDVEQLVLVSNDSDLAPAIEMISIDYPSLTLGIVLPGLHGKKGRKSGQLQKIANWTREYLREEELILCQLPDKIQNPKNNKTIKKPIEWS